MTMKKVLLSLGLIVMVCAFANCGSSEAESPDTTASNTAAPSSNKAEKKDEGRSAKPVDLLNPNTIDSSKPIPVAALKETIFAWEGKEVAVIGYVYSVFNDSASVGTSAKLLGEPGSEKKLIQCDMKQGDNERFAKTTPVIIKGKVNGTYGPDDMLRLKDCEVVSKGDAGEKGKADPSSIDLSKPIPASELHSAYFAWEGKQISVIGNYSGTTTSRLKSGDRIRVDLSDPSGKRAVGCHMKTDPGKVTERNNRVIKGIVKGRSFDQVNMEDCEFVN